METDEALAVEVISSDQALANKTSPDQKSDEPWFSSVAAHSFCIDAWTADHAWELAEMRLKEKRVRAQEAGKAEAA